MDDLHIGPFTLSDRQGFCTLRTRRKALAGKNKAGCLLGLPLFPPEKEGGVVGSALFWAEG